MTANTSWMSSKISGLFLSRIFMRSLRTMMIFWVRSSAPCLELFSAAPGLDVKIEARNNEEVSYDGCWWRFQLKLQSREEECVGDEVFGRTSWIGETHLQSYKIQSKREEHDSKTDKWLLISTQENKENKKVGVKDRGGGGICVRLWIQIKIRGNRWTQ